MFIFNMISTMSTEADCNPKDIRSCGSCGKCVFSKTQYRFICICAGGYKGKNCEISMYFFHFFIFYKQ